MRSPSKRFTVVALLASIALTGSVVLADHQWSKYHWKAGTSELVLTVGDNHIDTGVGYPSWTSILPDVTYDWDYYSGPHLGVQVVPVPGGTGDIESYNDNYGGTGWLGLARISVTRGKNKHIVSGEALMNDFYVTLAGYDGFNQLEEWQHVLCQEIGHDFGLDHNPDGAAGGVPDDTCMNTETRPLRYPWPNIHDTDELNAMYVEDHDGGGGGGRGGGGGGGGRGGCHPVRGCGVIVHATWAEHYDDETEMFDAADLVVTGTVQGSRQTGSRGRADRAVPVTQVTLRVEEMLKGDAGRRIVLSQTRGPNFEIGDDPGYVSGDEYLLYLRETGAGLYRVVSPQGRIRF